MTKKVRQLEEEFESTEGKLKATSEKLEQASKAADESERLDNFSKVFSNVCDQKSLRQKRLRY